jgi:hypothetical protein
MTPQIRSKLSIAFSVYNIARAKARRAGDKHQIDLCNKVLGRMVKAAYRRH